MIYQRVLSANNSDQYEDGILGTSNLFSYYKFDELSGTTLIDSSGNGNDGTYEGNFSLGQPGLASLGGRSVSFDALPSDRAVTAISMSAANDFNELQPSVTMSFWIKTSDTDGTILNNGSSSGNIKLYIADTNMVVDHGATLGSAVLRKLGTGEFYLSHTTAINDGNSHHVAWSRNNVADTYKIYVDGVLGPTINQRNSILNSIFTCMESVDGTIDNFACWSRVLTDQEILDQYNAGA